MLSFSDQLALLDCPWRGLTFTLQVYRPGAPGVGSALLTCHHDVPIIIRDFAEHVCRERFLTYVDRRDTDTVAPCNCGSCPASAAHPLGFGPGWRGRSFGFVNGDGFGNPRQDNGIPEPL